MRLLARRELMMMIIIKYNTPSDWLILGHCYWPAKMDKNKTKSWIISNVLRWKISSASLAILAVLAIVWSVLH